MQTTENTAEDAIILSLKGGNKVPYSDNTQLHFFHLLGLRDNSYAILSRDVTSVRINGEQEVFRKGALVLVYGEVMYGDDYRCSIVREGKKPVEIHLDEEELKPMSKKDLVSRFFTKKGILNIMRGS